MNDENKHCLGEISVEEFLKQYWQQKPLLIRNAFPDIQPPLSADELAGLACEEHVNSRLVIENTDTNRPNTKPWQLEFGPFDEDRFSELPDNNWSLLVSDVERHFPKSKSILKAFQFIPDWRIDDLMISYAPPGGSVGAHVDAYDVFLIQLSGQRLWKISENFSSDTIDNIDLSILKDFTAEQEWILEAGDMLYLPPNVAHHGIAYPEIARHNITRTVETDNQIDSLTGNTQHCMTASVGFRAPSINTLRNEYIHYLSEQSNNTDRYRDLESIIPDHHAEISEQTVDQFIDYLKQSITFERDDVRRWLGEYCSDNKAFEDITECLNTDFSNAKKVTDFNKLIDCVRHSYSKQKFLQQSPYSNFLFSNTETVTLLFVNGLSYQVSKNFAHLICDDRINIQEIEQMEPQDQDVLLELFNNGAIIIAE